MGEFFPIPKPRISETEKPECEFLRKLEEVKMYCDEVSRRIERLAGCASELTTEQGIIKLFENDVDRIKREYREERISRTEARQRLEDLKAVANELEKHTRDMRRWFTILNDNFSRLRRFIEPPEFGVPVGVVRERIGRFIEEAKDDLPRKEFGILDISISGEESMRKIHEFVEEYSSGVIISRQEIKEAVEKTLKNADAEFESRKVGARLVFTVVKK